MQSAETDVVRALLRDATNRPIPVLFNGKPVTGDWEGQGYLGVALQSAFYELLHARSFSEAVVHAIERGGDTDTNGSVVGAMLGICSFRYLIDLFVFFSGARFGIENIPSEWLYAVQSEQRRSNAYAEVSLADGDALVERLISPIS